MIWLVCPFGNRTWQTHKITLTLCRRPAVCCLCHLCPLALVWRSTCNDQRPLTIDPLWIGSTWSVRPSHCEKFFSVVFVFGFLHLHLVCVRVLVIKRWVYHISLWSFMHVNVVSVVTQGNERALFFIRIYLISQVQVHFTLSAITFWIADK